VTSGLVTLVVAETGRAPKGRGAASVALQWTSRWEGERPESPIAGGEGEADLTLSLAPEDARAILEGRLSPSVAYMQGRLKASGDNELLLKVLEWSASPAFAKALQEWRGQFEAIAG
jgi:predicted lipid carrier protein YhbT